MEDSGHGDSLSDGVTVFPVSVFFHRHRFGVFLISKKEPNKLVLAYGAAGNEIYQDPFSFLGCLLHTFRSACRKPLSPDGVLPCCG